MSPFHHHAAATRLLARALLLALGAGVAMLAGAAPSASKLQISEDGSAIVDARSGLIWSRCVEGMSWDGKTCKGTALKLTLGEAQARASQRKKAEELPWRLPRVMDLKRLMDGQPGTDGIDAKLFPAAPGEMHWTGTANVRAPGTINPYRYDNVMRGNGGDDSAHLAFLHGWAVDMSTGEPYGDVTKRSKLVVRLVRSIRD